MSAFLGEGERHVQSFVTRLAARALRKAGGKQAEILWVQRARGPVLPAEGPCLGLLRCMQLPSEAIAVSQNGGLNRYFQARSLFYQTQEGNPPGPQRLGLGVSAC